MRNTVFENGREKRRRRGGKRGERREERGGRETKESPPLSLPFPHHSATMSTIGCTFKVEGSAKRGPRTFTTEWLSSIGSKTITFPLSFIMAAMQIACPLAPTPPAYTDTMRMAAAVAAAAREEHRQTDRKGEEEKKKRKRGEREKRENKQSFPFFFFTLYFAWPGSTRHPPTFLPSDLSQPRICAPPASVSLAAWCQPR